MIGRVRQVFWCRAPVDDAARVASASEIFLPVGWKQTVRSTERPLTASVSGPTDDDLTAAAKARKAMKRGLTAFDGPRPAKPSKARTGVALVQPAVVARADVVEVVVRGGPSHGPAARAEGSNDEVLSDDAGSDVPGCPDDPDRGFSLTNPFLFVFGVVCVLRIGFACDLFSFDAPSQMHSG
jgi:hypothetical protein